MGWEEEEGNVSCWPSLHQKIKVATSGYYNHGTLVRYGKHCFIDNCPSTIIERQDSQTPFLEGTHLGIKRVEARTGFDQSD